MRVLVCGGRNYGDHVHVNDVLNALHAERPISAIITGAASGADQLASKWAQRRGVRVDEYPADWRRFGLSAGPLRNKLMLDAGHPAIVVAFPGGKGTANMVWAAKAAGIEVRYADRDPVDGMLR